jgi:predicted transcriptional regulator
MPSLASKTRSQTSRQLFWDGEDNLGLVIFDVATFEDAIRRTQKALKEEYRGAHISFPSADRLFSVMTPRRWAVFRVMAGAGPLSIREVARRVKRDVKGVHGDVHTLLSCGVLSRTQDGRIVFPFNEVRVDVVVKAAA